MDEWHGGSVCGHNEVLSSIQGSKRFNFLKKKNIYGFFYFMVFMGFLF